MREPILLGSLAFMGCLPAFPQPVGSPENGPLTIDAAVQIAVANHPSLSIAANSLTAARGALKQSRSARLPSLDGRADFSRSMTSGRTVVDGVPIGEVGRRFATQYTTSVSANQLIYDFGRTEDEIRQSRFQALAARHLLAQTEDDVAYNVRQMFLALLANSELLEVAQHRVRLQEETLERASAQEEAGIVPYADVVKAESALAAAQLEVTSAQNTVALSRVTLNEAMGIDVRTDYAVAIPAPPDPVALTIDELIEAALGTRAEVLAAQADVKAAQAALSVAEKGLLPSLTGGASYGRREETFPPDLDFWSLRASLSVPIFDGGFTDSRVQQARAQRDTARDALYQTSQLVAQETAQNLLDLRTAIEEIRAAEITVASAQEDLRLANGRYDATVGILLEILDAQSALTAAQVELARAKFARADAYYALERAVGCPLAEIGSMPDETDADVAP